MAQCAAIKGDGGGCKAQAIESTIHCFNHYPDYADKRKRRPSKGGKRGGRGRPSTVLARLQSRLKELAEQVLVGEVDKDVASTAGRLLNYSGSQMRHLRAAREAGELEERVVELEEALERQKQEKGRMATRDRLRRLHKAAMRLNLGAYPSETAAHHKSPLREHSGT